MRFASIQPLQRDHGMPFVVASNIVREQTALARKHCRAWFAPEGTGSWELLTRRCAQTPILATTHPASASATHGS